MTIHPTSIIVCTYNRAGILQEVIKRLRGQNYPAEAFEILVIDNNSTDETKQIVKKIISEPEPLLRYEKEERRGITYARNRGAQVARFPYLAYLDDDCIVEAGWLSNLVSGFDLDEKVSIVAGRITVDYSNQKIPHWIGEKSERWLGKYDFPGTEPRILDNPLYVCEGNMAIKHNAWEDSGGFLGMDQFSSPHVAAQEIVYLLDEVKKRGGKVAFVPKASANHLTKIPTQQEIVKRAYWHGISDGILDYFLYNPSWISIAYRTFIDIAALFVFIVLSILSLLGFDKPTAMYHLLRAAARFGRILSETHLKGDWKLVSSWKSTNLNPIN